MGYIKFQKAIGYMSLSGSVILLFLFIILLFSGEVIHDFLWAKVLIGVPLFYWYGKKTLRQVKIMEYKIKNKGD